MHERSVTQYSMTQYACIIVSISMVLWNCIEMRIEYRHRPKGSTVSEDIKRVIVDDLSVARKVCTLVPEPGPCRANIEMYYFNPNKGECDQFTWGGCQGNGNRFDSEMECLNRCLKNATQPSRPVWCSLSFDYGYCFGAVKRYYYDHMWKVCKEVIYSGCGGNKNNFYSVEQCDSICRFGRGKLDTAEKAVTGPKKVLIINPADATAKRGLIQRKKNDLRMDEEETVTAASNDPLRI